MTDIKIEALAYRFYVEECIRKGFPRNEDDTMMTAWQLYDYWLTCDRREPLRQHVLKQIHEK